MSSIKIANISFVNPENYNQANIISYRVINLKREREEIYIFKNISKKTATSKFINIIFHIIQNSTMTAQHNNEWEKKKYL